MSTPVSHAEHLPQLAQIIEEASGIESEAIVPEAKISELGIDSLSLIEIAVRTEDTFGVRLDDSTVLGFTTVGEMLDYIVTHEDK
ncbi:acyl carrier protein [Corynebacterium halotolerans]|uniref:Acyl carrier protein n=1 Tax=Corynebacterium halotolerans YIM 70093 = DSM 44683 TaxID=1121362 RepID=M1P8M7_9CORY|nr:acyl carrier protein [Corynebacterium halotolerans]AGF73011.1 acyl carrier protein [Corynebacterium halotolerans YIM 70093 = DSM 44683]